MFDWARWSTLQAMTAANVPGAAQDGWLEGWAVGFAQHQWRFAPGLAVLDVRPTDEAGQAHVETYRRQDATVATLAPEQLPFHSGAYDLIVHLSFERARCFQPIDFAQPFQRVEQLLAAAALLKPGGALFWSYPYVFPTGPEDVHEVFEPAAVFEALTQRGYLPLRHRMPAAERLQIYHDPDTLFVDQENVLRHAGRQQRIIRVFAGVVRPGGKPRVQSLHFVAKRDFLGHADYLDEIGTRAMGKVFAGRVLARLGQCFTRQGGE